MDYICDNCDGTFESDEVYTCECGCGLLVCAECCEEHMADRDDDYGPDFD